MTDDTSTHEPSPVNALARLTAPAVCLIVINVINLILAGLILNGAMTINRMDDDEFQKIVKQVWDELDPGRKKTFIDQGWTFKDLEEIYRKGAQVMAVWMGFSLCFTILAIVGGVGMLKGRRRGLAITGSILTAIPGVSCLSCVLIGEGIGIWCMVVLFSSDVAAAFAANTPASASSNDDAWPTDRPE